MKTGKLSMLVFALCVQFFGCHKQPASESYQTVFNTFQNPTAEYRSAPLWVWNNRVSKADISEQLTDFRDHGIGGVFIHPRPGLITPYLSQEWLDLCAFTVEKAKELGMKVWIYDENSYPSGFAGGHVPAEMPDAIGKGLRMTRMAKLPKTFAQKPLLVLAGQDSGFKDVTGQLGQIAAKGDYYVFDLKENKPSPWFGGFDYVDIMRQDVTKKFLDVTMEPYKKVLAAEFGKTVPGVFQDEAHIAPVDNDSCVNYTPELFTLFQKKWAYDLRLQLPALYLETGDWRRVRHNYYAALLDLFIDNWAKPYSDYCVQNQLLFTGHYWEHTWPAPYLCPDNMALAAYSQMPGIDILMNRWSTKTNGQFGNNRSVREIRSIANQIGAKRTMSETYGAAGWDLGFFDQKRIGDWEYALGINFLNQHLSYMTIMGARKRDHPQSFSYHEPWWPAYKIMADYFARLSVAMSAGNQKQQILVIEPTTSAWMYYDRTKKSNMPDSIGNVFQNFVTQLEAWQIEYDLGSEDVLKRGARVENADIKIGPCSYNLVILPPGIENLDSATVSLLTNYAGRGGHVLSWATPQFCDGRLSDRIEKAAAQNSKNWHMHKPDSRAEEIWALNPSAIQFSGLTNTDRLFHHRRTLQNAELVFLVNSSDQKSSSGYLGFPHSIVEEWDAFTGTVKPYPVAEADGVSKAAFTLAPGASLLLCVRPGSAKALSIPSYRQSDIPANETLQIQKQTLNVLTIDYCDLKINGAVKKDIYFYDAQHKTFEVNGLPGNPWDSAVQYKTNIIDKDKFVPNSGFEACYWFTATPGVDLATLQLVVERPGLWKVMINDKLIDPIKDAWWLDKAFGVYAIGADAQTGKNKITLKAETFTIHTELEPVYLRGNFALKAEVKGFTVIPFQPMQLGAWNSQGAPFYPDGVVYSHTFTVPPAGKERYKVSLGKWSGTFARVMVNDKQAGFIAFNPAELDISTLLVPGTNEIKVIVYGSLKNLLGPHHDDSGPGAAWPNMFQKGAKKGYPSGSAYSTLAYGLMEDFRLVKCALE